MTTLHRTLFLLLCALTLVAFGCESEEDPIATDTGSGSDTGGTDTGGTDTGGTDTAGTDTAGTDTTGTDTAGTDTNGGMDTSAATTDLCTGPDDTMYLTSTVTLQSGDMGTGRDAATEAAQACGIANLGEEDRRGATIECMQDDPYAIGLSDPCTGCYGDIVLCSAENCLSSCAANPSGMPCQMCQNGDNPAMINCVENFNVCTGL